MTLILLICLLCITMSIVLMANGYDLLSPGSLYCAVFILSAATLLFLGSGISIGINTVSVIWFCSIAFCAGEMLANAIDSNRKLKSYPNRERLIAERESCAVLDIRLTALVCMIMLFAIVYTVFDLRGSAIESGLLSDGALVAHGVEKSFLSSLLNGFTSAIAYAFLGIFLFNYVFNGRIVWQCIAVDLLYLPIPIVTGSRIQILFFVVVGVCIYSMLISRKHVRKKEACLALIKKAALVLILILIAFYLLGMLTGKSQSFKLLDIVLVYLGAPITGFDQCVNTFYDQIANQGILGFKELSGILNVFGVKTDKAFFGFFVGGSYGYYAIAPERGLYGNVYTSLFYWMHNFGFIGTLLTCFILSFGFSVIKLNVSHFKRGSFASVCCFSIYYIPMFFLSIDDLFGDDLTYKRMLVALVTFLIVRWYEKGLFDWRNKQNSFKSAENTSESNGGELFC